MLALDTDTGLGVLYRLALPSVSLAYAHKPLCAPPSPHTVLEPSPMVTSSCNGSKHCIFVPKEKRGSRDSWVALASEWVLCPFLSQLLRCEGSK